MSGSGNLRSGERRFVTVLFADMKDFTALSRQLDPEETDALMTRLFSQFEAIVQRYGGAVEKYIGDAMVAVFGAPRIHEDDPTRAVSSALDFLDEISKINNELKGRQRSISFRIGINTGLITTGRRGDFDVVTGHAMSVASRLQAAASPNSVLVSHDTRLRCERDFLYDDPTEVTIEGTGEKVVVHPVRGRNTRLDDDESCFVGRSAILDQLHRSYLKHDPGVTGGFLLVGEAGMGKTRTATELIERIRRFPEFRSPVLYARAQRFRARPFAVVVDLLTSFFGITSAMDRSEIASVVGRRLELERKAAESFASLVVGDSAESDNQAFVVVYLVLKQIVAASAGAPYAPILFIDNLYFADKQSRDFFRFFLKNAESKPFFLVTDRNTHPGVYEPFDVLERIELPPLTREESRELIAGLDAAGLTEVVSGTVLENSRGNPLFVREYVRFASDNRNASTLPTTIQSIFLTSIDSYETSVRDLLKKLSVFVHSFTVADVRRIQERTDSDPGIAESALSFFETESILMREGALHLFRADVFKRALYDSLLNHNKRILHRIIAEIMHENGSPHPLRLLHHLIRAGDDDAAVKALHDSPNSGTNAGFLPFIDVLLDRIDQSNTARYMELLFAKATILFNNGAAEQADSLLKDIIEIAVDKQHTGYAGAAYHLLTAYNRNAFCFGKAYFCGSKALAYYDQGHGSLPGRQNLLEIMSQSELLSGDEIEAERLLDLAEESPDFGSWPDSRPDLVNSRAEHLVMIGEYRVARQLLEPQTTQPGLGNTPWLTANTLLQIACFHLGDWERTRSSGAAFFERQTRHYSTISQTQARAAVASFCLGETEDATERLQQAEFTSSQIGNDFDLLDAARTLSECFLLCNVPDKAESYARVGLGVGLRHTATYPVMTLLMILTELSIAQADEPAALFFLEEARLLAGRGVLLRNRDTLLFHYYRSELAAGAEEEKSSARQLASEALNRELDNIGEKQLTDSFLQTRSFGRIARDLLNLDTGMGT